MHEMAGRERDGRHEDNLLLIEMACGSGNRHGQAPALDRTVALDIVVTTLTAAGARFASVEPAGAVRVLTPAGAAAQRAEELRLEELAEAAAHPRLPGSTVPAAHPGPAESAQPTADDSRGEVR